jgi:hypothetical protein
MDEKPPWLEALGYVGEDWGKHARTFDRTRETIERRRKMNEMNPGKRRLFWAIIIMVMIGIALVGIIVGRKTQEALGGEFEGVALAQVTGDIKHIALFCFNQDCKWVIAVDVTESTQIQEGPLAIAIPAQGEIQTVDVRDSRVNLWVEQDSRKCTEDGAVRVCEYTLKEDMKSMVYVYREIIGTSGLPEYDGTPR